MTAENFFQRHASLTRESPVHEESREAASVSLVTVSVLCSYYHCHHCHHWFNLSVIAVISNQVEILSWCRFKFKVSSHIYHVFIISYSSVSSPLNSLTFSLSSLTRKTKVINLSLSQSLCSPLCRQQCDLCSMSPWLSSLLVCVRQLYSSPETKPSQAPKKWFTDALLPRSRPDGPHRSALPRVRLEEQGARCSLWSQSCFWSW